MTELKKSFILLFMCFLIPAGCYALDIENTADNPRLVNLTPQQFRTLDMIEKRIYDNSFGWENTMDRIERLELDLFDEIQHGSPAQRLNTLRIESTKAAIRGTAMTPMMEANFNTKYINAKGDIPYHDGVGIIDGLIRAWWPDLYSQLSEYRKYKEANFW